MTDQHPTQPQGYQDRRSGTGLVTPDGRSSDGHDTGESSTSGSLRNTTSLQMDPQMTTTSSNELDDILPLDWKDSSPASGSPKGEHARGTEPSRRKQRHTSSGGFLLHDAVARDRDHGSLRKLRSLPQPKANTLPRTPKTPQSNPSSIRDAKLRISRDGSSNHSTTPPQKSTPERSTDESAAGDSKQSSSQPSAAPLDVDSAQVVHMALNLSESRRIASRRNVSHATPPRLAPLPDRSSGSNLRQHFQQQRKSSHAGSPKPSPTSSPRVTSGRKLSNPLQPAFDAGQDNQYRYYFSSSTLARAQRAKEHLELMAQYRRLLETLPPLKPKIDRSVATSPPSSPLASSSKPARFGTFDVTPSLGRRYNPLQYIRNRKVRARERLVIDGEKQGFGDAACVKSWVDRVHQRANLADTLSGGTEWDMPAFAGAEESGSQASPEAASKTGAKTRRPRVDWFMEPCDMVADAYWLEQDNHKQLIEDRDWRKIFPPESDMSRPMSKQTEDNGFSHFSPETKRGANETVDAKDAQLARVDTDMTHSSAKERAKHTIQNIKGFSHRHTGSANNHDFLRMRKESISEYSDSDNDVRNETKRKTRHGRNGSISSSSNDLLQKQMLEMIAKEAHEKELADLPEDDEESLGPLNILTPERNAASKPSSRMHSRKGSLADVGDLDRKSGLDKLRRGSPPRYGLGRQSLITKGNRDWVSSDKDASLPNSPELQATRAQSSERQNGTTLPPPWSRPGSPTRSPITKMKQKMREKSTETDSDIQTQDAGNDEGRRISVPDTMNPSDSATFPTVRNSSLERKGTQNSTHESLEGVRRSTSLRQRPDDQPVGLRGMFKGPRIDNVLRGGVSKLGDMLWKKDGSSESQPDVDSTDESDSDAKRGRRRASVSASRSGSKHHRHSSRPSKHFLDSMPHFHHAVGSSSHLNGVNDSTRTLPSRTEHSSTFDYLKPPSRDNRSGPSSVSPPGAKKFPLRDSDVSESESYPGSAPELDRDISKRRSSGLEPPTFGRDSREKSRQWSIADRSRSNPPERTQLSRREVARMRALILSSGIKAMEVNRRAKELHKPFDSKSCRTVAQKNAAGVPWSDIAQLSPEQAQLCERQAAHCELYPLAVRTLGVAIQASGQRWQTSADRLTTYTSPDLQKRIRGVRSRIADDLSEMTRKAADEADAASKDLALDQPLKVKYVVDVIEKMLRKRRRRFRWARRALWLTVEWLLVGFMWYVWFVVMILRVFLGVGKAGLRGAKWLLWM